ncbi:L-aspartate oxidase [Bacillus nakamurai]|uniref:L-aspartate oxidase n=1 Tax=Bacillus nakamurai TaxID=1793963 RepID=A0A150F3L2_9BACI|nr:L-aspartate oxidase [Bacillus nakamurai]KXZ15268.1 L-aspartate oxidase [Bacillus nakamurai]MED1226859.1 L-aspartate oxidase [Bacillus nakamurai]
MSEKTIIVIGSGTAALSFASSLPPSYQVTVITKKNVKNSNSHYAQGGIAASYAKEDSIESHVNDTLYAGCGHNDVTAVRELLKSGKKIINQLIVSQFPFDVDSYGEVSLGKEGAHSIRRILHAGGDATGRILVDFLLQRLSGRIQIIEHETALDLLIEHGRCAGVAVKDAEGSVSYRRSDYVVLAAGGCGNLYQHHTNDSAITGDGIALAYRAGAEITDMEFTQFHPTLLIKNGAAYGLISEAVRGEGGCLTDLSGRRIMAGRHPLEDLAPRDVVSRAIHEEMMRNNPISMDCSRISGFEKRFPTITGICQAAGIDISDGIPVAPGMHFLMGGVKVNTWGETAVPDLYAIGETACTGLHGANRLASNSLLEALVSGQRAAEHIIQKPANGRLKKASAERDIIFQVPDIQLQELQARMTNAAGIVREKEQLQALEKWLSDAFVHHINMKEITIEQAELSFLWQAAKLVTVSALLREESRGAHFRSDFPQTEEQWRGKQIIHSKSETVIRKNEGIWKQWTFCS